MKESVELKYYTASDIRKWLFEDVSNGLTDYVISRNRAFSLINNPFVLPDTVLLSVIFIDSEVAAYTAVFPDKMNNDYSFFWGTTLFVNPKFEGKALGYMVLMHIKDACEKRYFASQVAPDAVSLNQKQGYSESVFYKATVCFKKEIKVNSLKSFVGKLFIQIKTFNRLLLALKELNYIKNKTFRVEYINYIDNKLYEFIEQHNHSDIFPRTQEAFNWILKYYFIQSVPLKSRVETKCAFSSISEKFCMYAVKVFSNEMLIGFYILRKNSNNILLMYLYFNEIFTETVYYSILEHILTLKAGSFTSVDQNIINFIRNKNIHLNIIIENISMITPPDFVIGNNYKIQGGDGDMLT